MRCAVTEWSCDSAAARRQCDNAMTMRRQCGRGGGGGPTGTPWCSRSQFIAAPCAARGASSCGMRYSLIIYSIFDLRISIIRRPGFSDMLVDIREYRPGHPQAWFARGERGASTRMTCAGVQPAARRVVWASCGCAACSSVHAREWRARCRVRVFYANRSRVCWTLKGSGLSYRKPQENAL